MHTKSDLEALSIEQLLEIAKSLNIPAKASMPQLELIYSIIEAELTQNPAKAADSFRFESGFTPNPKKRTIESPATVANT